MYRDALLLILVSCSFVAADVGNIQCRIVGGVDADIDDFPYQVSIEYFKEHSCGGSIISHDWIVTAAHCFRWKHKYGFRVRAGSSIRETGGTLHAVNKIISHPKYIAVQFDYDVAVLKVSTPFNYSRAVKSIPLTTVAPPACTPVVVSGWGSSKFLGELATQLQQVQVYIVDRNDCEDIYTGIAVITKRMICAGVPEENKGICLGDSGGPLVADGHLVGIVSWGVIGTNDWPDVYVNVAELRHWIVNTTDVRL